MFQKHLINDPKYDLNEHVRKGYPQAGLVGYYVTRKGAIKIVSKIKPLTKPIDNMISDLINNGELIAYIPKKTLIYMPYKFKSNIWTTTQMSASDQINI